MAKSYHDFYTTVAPGQKLGVECVDDRGYKNGTDSLRIAAGPLGVAQDVAAAMAMHGNMSALNVPIGGIAKISTRALSREKLNARTHHECAAELSAVAVALCVVGEDKETQDRAGIILGRDISDAELSGAQRYFQDYLRDESVHYRGADEEAICMDTHGAQLAIERSALAFPDHKGATFLSNHRRNTVFQTQTAYEAGIPHYNLDIWAAERYAQALSGEFPVSPDAIMASTAIRHAAITQLLPNPAGGQGIDIELRAA